MFCFFTWVPSPLGDVLWLPSERPRMECGPMYDVDSTLCVTA